MLLTADAIAGAQPPIRARLRPDKTPSRATQEAAIYFGIAFVEGSLSKNLQIKHPKRLDGYLIR